MTKMVKVAISLPKELLDAAEHNRHLTGESRSEYFRRGLLALLQAQQRQAASERYIRGYRAQPERDEEIRAARESAAHLLAQDPWD